MPTYVNDNEDIWTFARIVNPQQQAITPSDVGSVTYTVLDMSALLYGGSGSTPGYLASSGSLSIPVNTVIMSELMTDYGWAQDGIGYNFRHRLPLAAITGSSQQYRGGHTIKIEYVLTSTNNTSTQDWNKLTISKYVTLAPNYST